MNLDLGMVTTGGGTVLLVRRARVEHLPAVVALLADDPLGRTRDSVSDDLEPYRRALAAIDADPAQLLVVAVAGAVDGPDGSVGSVVGTLQLTVIPGLSRRGALRGQVEAVRVHELYRSSGLGAAMLGWAAEEARRRGCTLLQLTSDKSRADAHRFYLRLGFTASHEGFKRDL